MNRRSFISSILKAAVGAQIIVPKCIDAYKWKKVGDLYIVNPEWINAPYEVAFIGHQFESQLFRFGFGPSFQDFITEHVPEKVPEIVPIRMNLNHEIVPRIICQKS